MAQTDQYGMASAFDAMHRETQTAFKRLGDDLQRIGFALENASLSAQAAAASATAVCSNVIILSNRFNDATTSMKEMGDQLDRMFTFLKNNSPGPMGNTEGQYAAHHMAQSSEGH